MNDAQHAHRGEIGVLAMGFVGTARFMVLPSLLRAFRLAYPAVELRVQSMTTKEQLIALSEQRLDVGLVRLPVDEAAFSWSVVATEPLMAVLPATHRLARRERAPLRMLANEPFILYPRTDSPTIRDTIVAMCHWAGFSPTIVQESAEILTIETLVAGGLGIALVIAPVGYQGRNEVVYKPIEHEQVPTWEMALVWRRDSEQSPVVRALVSVREGMERQAGPQTKRQGSR